MAHTRSQTAHVGQMLAGVSCGELRFELARSDAVRARNTAKYPGPVSGNRFNFQPGDKRLGMKSPPVLDMICSHNFCFNQTPDL